MFQLCQNNYFKVLPLFDSIYICKMLLDSIRKDSRGKVWVNNLECPTTALIKTDFDSYVYFGGDTEDHQFIDEAKNYLIHTVKPKVIIIFSPTEQWKKVIDDRFSEYGPFRVTRHLFELNHEKFMQTNQDKKIPSDFEIESVKSNNSFEFFIKKDSEIVSQCASVFIGDGKAEISIETDENYRRQGFAFIITSAFIEYCLKNGLEPNWSCWDYNKASFQLALQLGFENHLNLQVHVVKMAR